MHQLHALYILIQVETAYAIILLSHKCEMGDLDPAPAFDYETQRNLNDAGATLDIQSNFEVLIGQLEGGEDLSKDQVEQYNAQLKLSFKAQLKEIEIKVEMQLSVHASDSVPRKLAKMKASKGVMSYLKSVFDWVIGALGWILKKIYEGIKWCYQKVKNGFKACLSFLGF